MPSKEELARIWAKEKPAVRIGKDGLDPGVIEEVKRQLKRQKVIKVKFLRSTAGSTAIDQLANELATRTSSTLWGRRGSVVLLGKQSR